MSTFQYTIKFIRELETLILYSNYLVGTDWSQYSCQYLRKPTRLDCAPYIKLGNVHNLQQKDNMQIRFILGIIPIREDSDTINHRIYHNSQ